MEAGSRSKEKVKVTELNKHVVCVLCGGYLVDATTIIECLHSFCRSCIVRYLDTSKYCPVCEVQIHKTKPLLSIRPDKTLQHLVYKLVPGLFQSEMKRRRDFYASNPPPEGKVEARASEDRGQLQEGPMIYTDEEKISLCLHHCHKPPLPYKNGALFCPEKRCHDSERDKGKSNNTYKGNDCRYLLCPATLKIGHLKKFIKLKFDLDQHLQIEVFVSDESLRDDYTLIDAAYISAWRRLEPLKLNYLVYDSSLLTVELPEPSADTPIITQATEANATKTQTRGRKPGRRKKQRRSRSLSNKSPAPLPAPENPEIITISTSDASPASQDGEEDQERMTLTEVNTQVASALDMQPCDSVDPSCVVEDNVPVGVVQDGEAVVGVDTSLATINGYEMEVAMEVQIDEGSIDAGTEEQSSHVVLPELQCEETIAVEEPVVAMATDCDAGDDQMCSDGMQISTDAVSGIHESETGDYPGSMVSVSEDIPLQDGLPAQSMAEMPPASQILHQTMSGSYISVQSQQDGVDQVQSQQVIHLNEGLNREVLFKSMTGGSDTVIILENESETIPSDCLQGTSSPIYSKFTPLQQQSPVYCVQDKHQYVSDNAVSQPDNHSTNSNTSVIDIETSTDEDNSYAKTMDIIENVENAHFALRNVVCIDADEPQVIEIDTPVVSHYATQNTLEHSVEQVESTPAESTETPCTEPDESHTVTIYIGKEAQSAEPVSSPMKTRSKSNSSEATMKDQPVTTPVTVSSHETTSTEKKSTESVAYSQSVILSKDNLGIVSKGAHGMQSKALDEQLSTSAQVDDATAPATQTEEQSDMDISHSSQDMQDTQTEAEEMSQSLDMESVCVDTHDVSNEVTSSASPRDSVHPTLVSDPGTEGQVVSTIEEATESEPSKITVSKATVETQTGFEYGELSPQNSSYSDGSKSPSERGSSESSLDGTPPRGHSRDSRGKSRERKSSKPVKIHRGGSRSTSSYRSEPAASRAQPVPAQPRPYTMASTTYPAASALASSASSSSSPQPAAPPAHIPHAHQQAAREAPPIKRLRLMCNGFDPSGPNNTGNMKPWMFPTPAHFIQQGNMHLPGMVAAAAATNRACPSAGFRIRNPYPQAASNPYPTPYGFPDAPAPPTSLANGYDQPLELVTKKSRDRKKEQEKEERRKKGASCIRVPHLVRP